MILNNTKPAEMSLYQKDAVLSDAALWQNCNDNELLRLSAKTLSVLSEVSSAEVGVLSSGVITSFALNLTDTNMRDQLNEDLSPSQHQSFYASSASSFDFASLLVSDTLLSASQAINSVDIGVAALRYGIPSCTCEMLRIANSSSSFRRAALQHVKRMREAHQPLFRLRCPEFVIHRLESMSACAVAKLKNEAILASNIA